MLLVDTLSTQKIRTFTAVAFRPFYSMNASRCSRDEVVALTSLRTARAPLFCLKAGGNNLGRAKCLVTKRVRLSGRSSDEGDAGIPCCSKFSPKCANSTRNWAAPMAASYTSPADSGCSGSGSKRISAKGAGHARSDSQLGESTDARHSGVARMNPSAAPIGAY